MDVVRQQVTADELLLMPYEGFRYVLVKGELRRMNTAGNVHGRIAASITWRLAQYVEENQLGTVYAAETGFRLSSDPDTVRAPDVAFLGQRRRRWRGRGFLAWSAGFGGRGGFTR